MKLLAQSNRHYLLIYLTAMIVSSAALFLGVRTLFDESTDERLLQLQQEIVMYVQVHDTLPVFFQSTSAKLIALQSEAQPRPYFSDTLLFNELEQEEEPYRHLRFGIQMSGAAYQVDVFQSNVETEDIAQMVLLLNLTLLLATFFALFWVQKRMAKRIWQPFYDTLERLRSFRLAQSEPMKLAKTDTDEFAELNIAIERLTEKTRQEYHSLKRFTENASHEIQTPLAVIRAKIETLLQSNGLSDIQMANLHSTQQAVSRLSRLQQNLLLLVKIENEQFQTAEKVDFKRLVASKLELLEDFIAAKKLRVQVELFPVHLHINAFLAETLLGNLLGNAVKHNLRTGGWLTVALSEHALIIRNSGVAPDCPAAELMERFRQSGQQTDGLGLGLAIAREICEKYGWALDIQFEEGVWITTVRFSNFR